MNTTLAQYKTKTPCHFMTQSITITSHVVQCTHNSKKHEKYKGNV